MELSLKFEHNLDELKAKIDLLTQTIAEIENFQIKIDVNIPDILSNEKIVEASIKNIISKTLIDSIKDFEIKP